MSKIEYERVLVNEQARAIRNDARLDVGCPKCRAENFRHVDEYRSAHLNHFGKITLDGETIQLVTDLWIGLKVVIDVTPPNTCMPRCTYCSEEVQLLMDIYGDVRFEPYP